MKIQHNNSKAIMQVVKETPTMYICKVIEAAIPPVNYIKLGNTVKVSKATIGVLNTII